MKNRLLTRTLVARSHPGRPSFAAGALALAVLALCRSGAALAETRHERFDHGGVVYAMTNAASGNQVLVYIRDRKGRLEPLARATASTAGRGGSVTAAVDPQGRLTIEHVDDEQRVKVLPGTAN